MAMSLKWLLHVDRHFLKTIFFSLKNSLLFGKHAVKILNLNSNSK